MSRQFEYYISVNGTNHEVKEGYRLHKIINADNTVKFELYDNDNNLQISFDLNDLNADALGTSYYGGGTANNRFNYIKKTKQIKNKSIKKHKNNV